MAYKKYGMIEEPIDIRTKHVLKINKIRKRSIPLIKQIFETWSPKYNAQTLNIINIIIKKFKLFKSLTFTKELLKF